MEKKSEIYNKFSSPIINGEIITNNSFKQVSILSPSFQYGLTVFEGIRAYKNVNGDSKPFLLRNHINRLINSSKLLGIKIDFSYLEIENDIYQLLNNNKIKNDIYIKCIIAFLDTGSWNSYLNPDRVVFCYELPSSFRSNNPEYLTASFTSINRISSNVLSPKIKCGANYINSRMGVLDVNDGFLNSKIPIFIDSNGFISETSGACIFIIKGKNVITPSLSSSVLESITRSYILESIASVLKDITFREDFIDRWDVFNADAVFIVGTNVEMKGIKKIDHIEYPQNNEILISIFREFRKIIS